jgi:hypothetical protein
VTDYTARLEAFIGSVNDIAEKIREAYVADDEIAFSEQLDDLLEELRTAAEYIETNRKK